MSAPTLAEALQSFELPAADPNRIELAAIEVLRTESGEAPEWIQVTFGEGDYEARDGRKLFIKSAKKLVREFNKRVKADNVKATIDWDHSEWSFGKFLGMRSPAAGWIDKLEVRDDGAIWAQVTWTEQGRADIEGLAYRYISPALGGEWVDRKVKTGADGEVETESVFYISQVMNAALVNNPALRMKGLFNAQPSRPAQKSDDDNDYPVAVTASADQPTLQKEEETTMSKAILALLGLAAAATEEEAIEAVQNLKTSAAQAETEKAQAQKDLETAQSRIAVLEAQAATATAEKAVDAAIKAHKVTPGQRDAMIKLATRDPALFEEVVQDAAPVALGESSLAGKEPAGKKRLSAGQKEDIASVLKAGTASKEALAGAYGVPLSEITEVANSIGIA